MSPYLLLQIRISSFMTWIRLLLLKKIIIFLYHDCQFNWFQRLLCIKDFISMVFINVFGFLHNQIRFFPTVSFPLFSLLFCMESSFRFCSSFTSVVIKYPDQKQPKEGKGLFVLRFQVIACYWRDVKAGTEAAGHSTATVKGRKRLKTSVLPASASS